jgi:tetratricopeptide (TPR) repeat protein
MRTNEPRGNDIRALVAMLNQGRVDEAERGARALLRNHPQAGILWKILGAALMTQGKEALEAQRKTAELMPEDAEAHAILGAALQNRGRWVEAAVSYRCALKIEPRSLEAQNNLGNVLAALGQFDDAVECYRRALQLKADDAEAHSNLGNALRQLGRPTEAIASCRRAVQFAPSLSAAHDNLGLALAARGHFEEAIESFRRSLTLNADNIVALCAMGNALRDLGELRQAASCHLRAIELDPKRAAAYYDLGNVMMDLGRLDEAAASYKQALALDHSHEAARLNLCVILRQHGRAAEAEALCNAALTNRPDSAEAITLLGELCADRGQFSEAQKLFQRAISINPDLPNAWSLVATHRKMTAEDSAWLLGTERLIAKRPPLRHEIRLRYALGKYFDDIERYDQAFDNFRLANELTKRTGSRYDRTGQTRSVDGIVNRFDRAFMDRVSGRVDSTLPVFIIGMPRSGTSLTEQILASHPAVYGAGELDFWDRAMAAYRERGAGILAACAKEYLERLTGLSGGALRVLDKMPANFMNAGLIHAVLPAARIIHMRRSPLDTCLSIYFHYFPRSHSYSNDLEDLAHFYGEYLRIMDHWRAVLPAANLLEVPYEALIEDQEGWTRRMLEFVGLPWDPTCLEFHRPGRVVITASNWQVRQPINTSSVGRWRHYANFVDPLRRLVKS